MLDFEDWQVYFGMILGGLLGFVQTAGVAGANPCAPQLVYTLEAAVLVNYEYPFIWKNGFTGFYLYDFLLNLYRVSYHGYGSYAYCSQIFFTLFGPVFEVDGIPP